MKSLNPSRCALSVCAAAILLSGCGQTNSTPQTGAPALPSLNRDGSGVASHSHSPDTPPVNPKLGQNAGYAFPTLDNPADTTYNVLTGISNTRSGQALHGTTEIAPHAINLGVKALAVSDAHGGVVIFNSIGEIERKLYTGDAYRVAYDNVGHLYVAENGAVAEYKSDSSRKPEFTYTKGLGLVVGIATDSARNVYAISQGQLTVIEYAQHRNAIVNQCHANGPNLQNIAVDTSRSALFISVGPISSNLGQVDHFPTGLNGCHGGAPLRVPFRHPFGLAIDSGTRNLLVSDEEFGHNSLLDILKPPYTRVHHALGQLFGVSIALNSDATNRLLFLVYNGIDVVHYPSGKFYTRISKGLTYASGAAVR